jgi:hypothetical protein
MVFGASKSTVAHGDELRCSDSRLPQALSNLLLSCPTHAATRTEAADLVITGITTTYVSIGG